jgi:pimeloyl-ACP methyl ester carboxylesterase
MSEGRFERGGVSFRYIEAGTGPGVLFQHGLGGDASQIDEIYPTEPSTHRLTLECRAHGGSQSGPLASLSIATFTDDVAALAADRGVTKAVMGGISMGAAIALRMAVTRPDLVKALVLARPAWMFAPAPDNMAAFGLIAELLRNYALPIAREIFEQSDVAKRLARDAPSNLASLRSAFAGHDPKTRAALVGSIARDGPGVTESEARGIAVPTLVIGTTEDTIHPLGVAETLAGAIPGADFVRITSKSVDPAAHAAEFRAALAAFFRAVL